MKVAIFASWLTFGGLALAEIRKDYRVGGSIERIYKFPVPAANLPFASATPSPNKTRCRGPVSILATPNMLSQTAC